MVSELISFSALQLSSNWFDSQLLNYALLLVTLVFRINR